MKTTTLQVTGMHCSSCSMLISMNLEDLAGVRSVDCDHATGRTSVGFDEEIIDSARILEAIVESGYGAECAE